MLTLQFAELIFSWVLRGLPPVGRSTSQTLLVGSNIYINYGLKVLMDNKCYEELETFYERIHFL